MAWRPLTSFCLTYMSRNVQFKAPTTLEGVITAARLNRRFCQSSTETTSTSSEGSCEKCKDYEAIKEQLGKLIEENGSLTDKYKRSLAETENLRKRSQRQIEEMKVFAIQSFCKDLLEVADLLDLATTSLEDAAAVDDSVENLHTGIKMTKEVLLKTFSKHGLVPIRPEGEKFDPNLHEAVFEVPKEQSKYPAGHVAHVMNIGYSLHNRPIRAAKVGVVKFD